MMQSKAGACFPSTGYSSTSHCMVVAYQVVRYYVTSVDASCGIGYIVGASNCSIGSALQQRTFNDWKNYTKTLISQLHRSREFEQCFNADVCRWGALLVACRGQFL